MPLGCDISPLFKKVKDTYPYINLTYVEINTNIEALLIKLRRKF